MIERSLVFDYALACLIHMWWPRYPPLAISYQIYAEILKLLYVCETFLRSISSTAAMLQLPLQITIC